MGLSHGVSVVSVGHPSGHLSMDFETHPGRTSQFTNGSRSGGLTLLKAGGGSVNGSGCLAMLRVSWPQGLEEPELEVSQCIHLAKIAFCNCI
jgi:hypothetical protein